MASLSRALFRGDAGVVDRAILARFVVALAPLFGAMKSPQTVPGSRGVEVGEARCLVTDGAKTSW